MINLMPNDIKEEIVYSRRNRILFRWIITIMVVIALVGAMTIFGQLYINKNIHSLQGVAKVTKQRIANQNLEATQKDIQSLSNNFTIVTQLLSRQLMFSKLLVKIGSIIPNGAVLSGINLTTTSSSLDLNVIATDREAATQAFVNISDTKNGLFEKADLISVNCTTKTENTTTTSTTSSASSKYPCTAMIKVVIKNDSSFYFLNSIKSGTKK